MEIEHPIRKLRDGRVHTTLIAENAHESSTLVAILPTDEPLEEGIAAIGQTDIAQARLRDLRLRL